MVTELTINDTGLWKVSTQGSVHIIDLDSKAVTRIPGEGRSPSINDRTRALRTLDDCRVGEPGRWTMISDDTLLEYYWHITSEIRAIESVPDEQFPGDPAA